jgi:hypothetical protein
MTKFMLTLTKEDIAPVRNQVWNQVDNQVCDQVRNQCCTSPLEVIGNIFDNPELLEECPVAKQMREKGTN